MINTVNHGLESEIQRRTGQKVRTCYQCKKCSTGCPVSFAMDLLPHEVMKMILYGQEERLLKSSTIWLCASCETCTTRCPNEIDIAGVMDGLREMAIDRGVEPAEEDVLLAHRCFLDGIKYLGKTNEPVLMGEYKLRSGDLLGDMGLAVVMMLKGKIKILPRHARNLKSVRRIFRNLEREEAGE